MIKTDDFYYNLPETLIAQHPAKPRDHSKLMVLNKNSGEIVHTRFDSIIDYLNAGDCLVVNDTKVLPARIFGRRQSTGANVEFLLLKTEGNDVWEVLAKPGRRAKPKDTFDFGNGLLQGTITDIVDGGNRLIKFDYEGVFYNILEEIGQMPLPPYITETLEDNDQYQTVYALHRGSAAAPTAGLHFTDELLDKIASKGINIAKVTLHVGLGTFRPVSEKYIGNHTMHAEHYSITSENADIINKTKKNNKRIVAVGTTSARTLEAASTENGILEAGDRWTDIFIYPGYKFKMVDMLITNFHLPKSSLIMLVSAFCGYENTMNAYKVAVHGAYRFFSFGDAMIIGDFT